MRKSVVGAAIIAGMLAAAAPAAFAATLTVSNGKDVVNGNTASPSMLIAHPGPDGISLREAIVAANNAAGPHTIKFSTALAGKSIVLASPLPMITRNGLTITGLKTSAGLPNLTIDGRNAVGNGPTVFLAASSFTMSALRFVYAPAHSATIQVGGTVTGVGSAPLQMSNIRFTGNYFSHVAAANDAFAIVIGSTVGITNGATISKVTVDNNTFTKLFEAVNLQGGGQNNVIRDVLIFRNTFTKNFVLTEATSAIEIGNTVGKNNKILRTQILQNTFIEHVIGIAINNNSSATGSLIDRTAIERNVFTGNLGALGVAGGTKVGSLQATRNTISNTRFANNTIWRKGWRGVATAGGIQIEDNQFGAALNKVNNFTIINNTFYGPAPPGGSVKVESRNGGVTNVFIYNSILRGGNAFGDISGVPVAKVRKSITDQAGYAGVNGNINVDPMFVNAAAGDFHLKTGSPALDAGLTTGAPTIDLDCRPRAAPPSIGAYESRGANVCAKTPPAL